MSQTSNTEEADNNTPVPTDTGALQLCGAKCAVKPPLKWVGGKTQMLGTILPKFAASAPTYHEPFLGGGSVALAIAGGFRLADDTHAQALQYGRICVSDVNEQLISMWIQIKSAPDELLQNLESIVGMFVSYDAPDSMPARVTAAQQPTTLAELREMPTRLSFGYFVRHQYNHSLSVRHHPAAVSPGGAQSDHTAEASTSSERAAQLIFLNKYCHKGVYRENAKTGFFNVPIDKTKCRLGAVLPDIVSADNIRRLSGVLKHVHFRCEPFDEALARVQKGDFVYLDPPYYGPGFSGYTASEFSTDRLLEECKRMDKLGAQFVMSNADHPKLTEFASGSGFNLSKVVARRAIHSKNPGQVALEVLVDNAPTTV